MPVEVRHRLGVGPGSVIEWHEEARRSWCGGWGSTIGMMFTSHFSPTGHPSLERSLKLNKQSGNTPWNAMRAINPGPGRALRTCKRSPARGLETASTPSLLFPADDRSEFAFTHSSLHLPRGDIHVIANEWRANRFPAAGPGDFAWRGPGLIARKDLDGRTRIAARLQAAPRKFAQAVAIANGRILAVGSDAEIQTYAGRTPRLLI